MPFVATVSGGRGGGGGGQVVRARPGPLEVVANHYVVQLKKQLPIYRHMVEISTESGRRLLRETRSSLVDQYFREGTELGVKPKGVVYDEDRLLIHTSRIPNHTATITRGRDEFTVSITPQDEVFLNEEALRQEGSNAAQTMDLIWKEAAKQESELVGNRLFCSKLQGPDVMRPLADEMSGGNRLDAHGKSLWMGHAQAAQLSMNKTGDGQKFNWTINMNAAGVVAWQKMSLLDYCCGRFRTTPGQLASGDDQMRRRLNRQVQNLKVETYHEGGGEGSHRTQKVLEISSQSAQQYTFEHEETTMSVAQYFERRWKKRLQHPDAPVVQVAPSRRNIFIPIELLYITRQKVTKQIEESVKAAVGNILTMPPDDRQKYIQMVKDRSFLQNGLLSEYGLDLDENMLKLTANVLSPPTLRYSRPMGGGSGVPQSVPFEPQDGAWNMAQKAFVNAKRIDSWAVVAFMPNVDTAAAGAFVNGLVDAGRSLNMTLHANPYRTKFPFTESMERFPEVVSKVMESSRNNCQICVCILPQRDTHLYRRIKLAFEQKCPTQCLVQEKTPILNGRDRGAQGHFCNILSKMNQKVQGTNQTLHEESKSRNILRKIIGKDKSCIVLGGDVTHPSVGFGAARNAPSLSALVGSLDDDCSLFAHSCRAGDKRSDIMNHFDDMFAEIMTQRTKYISNWPKRVIYLRDGVSEGQLDSVIQAELGGISRAYEAAGQPPPMISCMVVQKRHQTRFFPNNPADRGKNVPPGTVVMDNLTHPSKYVNFYLVSHAGIKGTSKPCRYFIIRNDMRKHIEDRDYAYLAFELCHIYGRCQKSVSLPAPVYYAHLLADRCRFLAADAVESQTGFHMLSDTESMSSGSGGKAGDSSTQEYMKTVLDVANNALKEVCASTKPMFYC